MDEELDYTNSTINYQNVVASRDLLAITRLTAADLIKCPYMSLGDFFRDISDNDLKTLVDIIEIAEDEPEHEALGNLVLLTEMLTTAEGVDKIDLVDAHERLNAFCMYVIVSSLHRKGLVKVHYENMSFGKDMGKKVVVERLDNEQGS